MKLISHRGNLEGKNLARENSPSFIKEALSKGYHVEVDVWIVENKYYLGHDTPQYSINPSFLRNKRLWCHAKNHVAFEKMLKDGKIHCFWHEDDNYTLTSRGIPWVYPNTQLLKGSVCVLPEKGYIGCIHDCKAICSDYINRYR